MRQYPIPSPSFDNIVIANDGDDQSKSNSALHMLERNNGADADDLTYSEIAAVENGSHNLRFTASIYGT